MIEFVQHLVNGLSLGSIYALIALGYTMVFGILQLINFAHGDVYMLGAFIGMYTARAFHLADNPSFGSLLTILAAAMIGCAGVGYLIERIAYRPLRKSPRINLLITAVGVSLFLEFSGQLVFGSDPKFFPQVFSIEQDFSFGELKINPLQVLVFGVSVVLMVVLQTIVFKTRVGRAMRAASFSHDLASLMGIPTDRVISFTFMLGSALAGAAGVLVGLIYPKIEPLMGSMPGLKAFVAAVLGGIGNVTGAVVGALLLGLAESFLVGYGYPTFRDALAFALLILILLFRPTGLFGTKKDGEGMSRNWILAFAGVAVLHFALTDRLDPYFFTILMYAGINATLAVSLNLVSGFTGQFSMGHAGFMSVGGYLSAFLTTMIAAAHPDWIADPVLSALVFGGVLIVAGLGAALMGYLVGLPSLRLRGDYLAIVTLGFGEIIRVIVLNVDAIGGREECRIFLG